jgi:hypothetical protein
MSVPAMQLSAQSFRGCANFACKRISDARGPVRIVIAPVADKNLPRHAPTPYAMRA